MYDCMMSVCLQILATIIVHADLRCHVESRVGYWETGSIKQSLEEKNTGVSIFVEVMYFPDRVARGEARGGKGYAFICVKKGGQLL